MKKCTRDDLRVEVIANSRVDDDGFPTLEETLETAGISASDKPYWCAGECGDHGLGTSFWTWEEALKHVEAAK